MIGRQLRNLKIPTMPHKIDWLGAFLILASAVPLMIGFSRVEQEGGWLNWPVVFPILLGIAATAALVAVELRVAEPMMPMRLFANKVFTVGNIAIFAPSMVITALVVIVPLYYQIVLKWPADQAGLQLIALTGGMAIGGFIVGSVVSRLGRAKMFRTYQRPRSNGFMRAHRVRWAWTFDVVRRGVHDLARGGDSAARSIL